MANVGTCIISPPEYLAHQLYWQVPHMHIMYKVIFEIEKALENHKGVLIEKEEYRNKNVVMNWWGEN